MGSLLSHSVAFPELLPQFLSVGCFPITLYFKMLVVFFLHNFTLYIRFTIFFHTDVVSFLELDPQSFDFQDLSRKFRKSWAEKKGACPTVKVVLAIVNPRVSKRFDEYVKTLPMKHQLIEQNYHGTSRLCSIGEAQYLQLCGNS